MKKICFNDNWFFSNLLKNQPPATVMLPHDAMQTEPRINGLKNGDATGYYPGGKYRYEKKWIADGNMVHHPCYLEFEGIYQKSTVYLNDVKIGGHIYGYTDFILDLTEKIKLGENTLRIDVDNSQMPNSRWYSGSGIYRDVYLYTAESEEYIMPYGLKTITKSVDTPALLLQVEAYKEADTVMAAEVYKHNDDQILVRENFSSQELSAGKLLAIPNAKLWSAETPCLYDIKVCLQKNGTCIDEAWLTTGIRELSWSHENGFMVNGQTVKLRGGCVHHDLGPLGAVSTYGAEIRRLQILKDAGFNAIRYAHNPASTAFLQACDEVGLYVMDEAFDMWNCRKSDRDYGLYFAEEWESDVTAMIRMAYSHPSVVMYSIGNEILDIGLPEGAVQNKKMIDLCHQLDSSRPVINALSPGLVCMAAKGIGINKSNVNVEDEVNPYECDKSDKASGSKLVNILITLGPLMMKFIGGPKRMEKISSPTIEALDITGYNYGLNNYDVHRTHHPNSVICGSETFNSGIVEHWAYVEEHPDMIGEFVWTAWDYLGETGIGLPRYSDMSSDFAYPYPCRTAACGCFDLIGNLDAQGAHVLAVWGKLPSPFIAVRPPYRFGKKVNMGRWRNTDAVASWTWVGSEGKKTEVQIFASAYSVELFQDGNSLGRRELRGMKTCYTLTYQPGKLSAKAYDKDGKCVGSSTLATASAVSQLTATAEMAVLQASQKDVAFIDIALADEKGVINTGDNKKIKVQVDGAGTLAAVGSADPMSEELFTDDEIITYQGRALVIVRSSGVVGDIKVHLTTEGLPEQTVTIRCI